MLTRLRRQSMQLDRYWAALRRNGRPAPPAGLTPDIADLAVRLAADMDQLAIRPLFLSSHRRLIGICARIVRL